MRSILRLHPADNVAIALSNLKAGEIVALNGLGSKTLELISDTPQMHKIATASVAKGDAIFRYGQTIGFASQPIHKGEHVHSHNCVIGKIEKDYGFCRLATPTQYVPENQQETFNGYPRPNGKVGTRNYIGILTTVNCSATVAKGIAQHFANKLDSWPNVDGVVALTHSGGCGMRTGDEGYDTLQRTFTGYLKHPNFGGVILIGLGCETMQVQQVLQDAHLNPEFPVTAYSIQSSGGTRKSIEQGIAAVEKLLPQVNACQRQPCLASQLCLAVQCGGSDGYSGITANPALGVAADLLIKQGGTVIYSETPEIYGAEHLLTQRATTPDVAEALLQRIRWWESYTQKHGFELDNNPSPGNKQGGLTTIIEKSLGAQTKSGSTNLEEFCLYAQQPHKKGLVFMDSPGYDPVSVTGQVASGANLICFTTGRGSAFGFKPVPSIKLASNTEMFLNMEEDMDINCGTVIDGHHSLEQMGEIIFEKILRIASGELSKSETLGYGDTEFNPWKIGAVL